MLYPCRPSSESKVREDHGVHIAACCEHEAGQHGRGPPGASDNPALSGCHCLQPIAHVHVHVHVHAHAHVRIRVRPRLFMSIATIPRVMSGACLNVRLLSQPHRLMVMVKAIQGWGSLSATASCNPPSPGPLTSSPGSRTLHCSGSCGRQRLRASTDMRAQACGHRQIHARALCSRRSGRRAHTCVKTQGGTQRTTVPGPGALGPRLTACITGLELSWVALTPLSEHLALVGMSQRTCALSRAKVLWLSLPEQHISCIWPTLPEQQISCIWPTQKDGPRQLSHSLT
eukprot:365139-Chlamydomonas_euryale.AAC.25